MEGGEVTFSRYGLAKVMDRRPSTVRSQRILLGGLMGRVVYEQLLGGEVEDKSGTPGTRVGRFGGGCISLNQNLYILPRSSTRSRIFLFWKA